MSRGVKTELGFSTSWLTFNQLLLSTTCHWWALNVGWNQFGFMLFQTLRFGEASCPVFLNSIRSGKNHNECTHNIWSQCFCVVWLECVNLWAIQRPGNSRDSMQQNQNSIILLSAKSGLKLVEAERQWVETKSEIIFQSVNCKKYHTII